MEGVIHVHHFGAQVRARDGMFSVFLPDLTGGGANRTEPFAPTHVRTILLHPNCSMTSNAMLLGEEHGTTCIVINEKGEPRVFLAGLRSPNVLEIWKRQLELHGTPEGLEFARNWLCLKVERKLEWMAKLRNYRKDQPDALRAISECGDVLMETKYKLLKQPLSDVKAAASSLRGFEGQGQKSWFRLINHLLRLQKSFFIGEISAADLEEMEEEYRPQLGRDDKLAVVQMTQADCMALFQQSADARLLEAATPFVDWYF